MGDTIISILIGLGILIGIILIGLTIIKLFIMKSKRDQLFEFLRENGIEVFKNEYPFSPAYPKLPKAAKYEAETLRIPCNESLKNSEIDYVISKIKEFYLKDD